MNLLALPRTPAVTHDHASHQVLSDLFIRRYYALLVIGGFEGSSILINQPPGRKYA